MYYAQLNSEGVCVGVSALTGGVDAPNLIPIDELDFDFVWRKYANEVWSTEKFEPPATAQLPRIEQLQQQVLQTSTDLQGFMDFFFANNPTLV